jgi:hypothetical protein
MAESCPGSSLQRRDTLRAWHVRDETYSKGWLSSSISSTDCLLPRTGAAAMPPPPTSALPGGRPPPAVGQRQFALRTEPGLTFYTHISDRYAPFHTEVINATVRDATHVFDGLLYHESDIKIDEHSTDTLGSPITSFSSVIGVFFRFMPCIRDLGDRRLYVPDQRGEYSALAPFIAEPIRAAPIRAQWPEVRRLVASTHGHVTASLMLRNSAVIRGKMALLSHCVNSAASSARCSSSIGCSIPSCGVG